MNQPGADGSPKEQTIQILAADGQDTQQWLADNAALLLPVNYFLVSFTVPEGLPRWIRSHPALGYDLLLAASSQALQDLAQNPKRLGATLGLLAVLMFEMTKLVSGHVKK